LRIIINITALRNFAPESIYDWSVKVLGYRRAYDYGGGEFYWDTDDTLSTDNGATVIVPSVVPEGKRTGCWKRVIDVRQINVKWFGAITDQEVEDFGINSSTNTLNDQAFAAAIALQCPGFDGALTGLNTGYEIYVPPGSYSFTTQLTVSRTVSLVGHGLMGQSASILRFWNSTNGLVLQSQCEVKNLRILGTGTTSDTGLISTPGYGIYIQSPSIVSGCWVTNFRESGILVNASVGVGTNANSWQVRDTLVALCHHGLYAVGGDSNAGGTINFQAVDNRGWGIRDDSFLGNTHIGPMTDGNVLGPCKTQGNSSASTFIGHYGEFNQPESEVQPIAIMLGGIGARPLVTFRRLPQVNEPLGQVYVETTPGSGTYIWKDWGTISP
jgi:hypothetical protein